MRLAVVTYGRVPGGFLGGGSGVQRKHLRPESALFVQLFAFLFLFLSDPLTRLGLLLVQALRHLRAQGSGSRLLSSSSGVRRCFLFCLFGSAP